MKYLSDIFMAEKITQRFLFFNTIFDCQRVDVPALESRTNEWLSLWNKKYGGFFPVVFQTREQTSCQRPLMPLRNHRGRMSKGQQIIECGLASITNQAGGMHDSNIGKQRMMKTTDVFDHVLF
ncbi:hypothetical protein WS7_03170 [Xanthomonas citri pv. malvacearum str. GSPB2388]|nr:hypothetical protein WS7_03170 [Xanthomonas citri pv. malvacearum str. GSPB2388]